MSEIALRHGLPTVPPRIAKLPRDARGYPVPYFVQWFDAPGGAPTEPGVGVPDFRITDGRKLVAAVQHNLCWVCGQTLGAYLAFVIGPMCAVNRVSSEPPSHRDCAVFSARACAFLAAPKAQRRESNKPEGIGLPGGVALMRNPGVALVWVTRAYHTIRDPDGKPLFRIGPPIETLWFAEGRPATRTEVMTSIDSGLPLLREIAERDGPAALAALVQQTATALALVPA